MVKNPILRLFIMVVVGIIAITSPIWANQMFDFYLDIYSLDERRAEGILLLEQQRLKLETNCFSAEIK